MQTTVDGYTQQIFSDYEVFFCLDVVKTTNTNN